MPQYLDVVLPDLILLNINMPIMDGHETFKHLKSDENLKLIPVVMLTSSSSSNEIRKAYMQYANLYIIKPYEISDLEVIVETLKNYWLKIVKLPSIA